MPPQMLPLANRIAHHIPQGRDFLLYLPGVDGLNVEAVEQFDYLSASFDTWCMTVQGTDRSNFDQLTDQVGIYITRILVPLVCGLSRR